MAEDATESVAEEAAASWRKGWAWAGALLAALLLVGLVAMVVVSNRAREEALAWERHTYDLTLLARTVDATVARSEAALGRFVLDEDRQTGSLYYSEWRLADRQIAQLRRLARRDAEQATRVDRLRELFNARGTELGEAAAAAARGQESGGVPLFYQAGQSETLPALRRQLEDIAAAERASLGRRIDETRIFTARADRFIVWLSWATVLVGLAAIGLALYAWHALTQGRIARREADSEAWRAQALEEAVQERTRALVDANERLREEAAERAAAEAKLRQVQKMEAVGQLTGGIAHDFNNMLAVVVGGLELARRKLRGPPREVEFHLDNAMEGATRAAALTRRLLAFARSEPLLPEGVAPGELIENMLDLIDRAIGERIAVRTSVPDRHWHVFADTHQLENAVVNLCVNARDAMDGSGAIAISVDNVTLGEGEVGALPAGPYVRIAVSDTGTGIAPEHLERVFEPFFTTKPVGKGTGLGLSQIFGFARQSGGDVAVDSTLGEGTTVAIYLPRSREAAEAAASAPDRTAATPAPAEQGDGGALILVVEDDPRVSRATVAALEELGHAPIACAGGREALDQLAANRRIALVISDVMMPEMTGPELMREMARLHPGLGILFVTGYVGEAGDAEELAGHDILRKPFTISALGEAVSAALARHATPTPKRSAA